MFEALTFKRSNCKNCYKCIRNCPVKAIRFSNGQAQIMQQDCILCGQCFVGCPQNAKQIVSEIDRVKRFIASGVPVIASMAPSFIARNASAGINSMRRALKKLGFTDVEETAIGATIVKKEYERIVREEKPDILITSCCHSLNLLIQKYYPDLIPALAAVQSPMQAHCADIKRRIPEAKTVFIGPCVSKKDEAEAYPGIVDAVLTYEELSDWLASAGVEPEEEVDSIRESKARLFPTSGGVLKTLTEHDPEYTYLFIDGTDACMAALDDIRSGLTHKCFIEMSACAGSCIGGPVMKKYVRTPVHEFASVIRYAGDKDFEVEQPGKEMLAKAHTFTKRPLKMPSEEEIKAALASMGKTKPTDELNCGTCGYNSCRDKAIAICRGIAEPTMCLPFLKEKAESVSASLISNSPYGIVVIDDDMNIERINRMAGRILDIPHHNDAKGTPIMGYMDPTPFLDVQISGRTMKDQTVVLEGETEESNKYLSMTVAYDFDTKMTIGIFQDNTELYKERLLKEETAKKTIETADALVAKQMRIVQEIASLLGETTAETKIALTKLKESVQSEAADHE